MDINNLDIEQTTDLLQNHVKSESIVTFQGVTIFKMNFRQFFMIVENQEGKRIFLPKDQNEYKNVVEQIAVDGQPLQIIYSENPVKPPYGTCPVCNGTGIVNSNSCYNCGGQYNSGIAKGIVPLNGNQNPCTHDYIVEHIRNSYNEFRCNNCLDSYHKNL